MIIAWFIDCIKKKEYSSKANRRIAYVRPHRQNINILLKNSVFPTPPTQIHIRFNEKCWYNIMMKTYTRNTFTQTRIK